MSKEESEGPSSYFGILSIRQGMRWIQVFMICISLINIYPSVTEAGYECEMSLTDSSAGLGTFSQAFCWIQEGEIPWEICKYNAIATFFSEFLDQIGLFFGLVLISSPKPSITYVKITRYLVMFDVVSTVIRLIYYAMAYVQGESFLKESSTCIFEESLTESDTSLVASHALKQVMYYALCTIFLVGYVWGTFALVPVLRRGGTGDERVAGEDVLSIVKQNPPKLLVLSSAFGTLPLRPAALLLSTTLVCVGGYNIFNNSWRVFSWCAHFDMESSWCIWPYGVLAGIDQILCIVISLYTCRTLLLISRANRLPSLNFFWAYLTLSSLALLGGSLFVITERYPSYWMNNMKSDVWVYYARFWVCLVMVVLIRSIAIVRIAGGVGSEDERDARKLIYENLSKNASENKAESDADSMFDLFGSEPREERKPKSATDSSESSRISSGVSTPTSTIVIGGSVIAVPAQAVDGVSP